MNLHVFDIDDTIAADTAGLTDKMTEVLIKLKQNNLVWFATGRGFPSAKKGLLNNKMLIKDSRIATENGGKIYLNDDLFEPSSEFMTSQIIEISKWIKKYKDDMFLCHFWGDGKLEAYFKNKDYFPISKNEFLSRLLSVDELIAKFQSINSSLIHVRFNTPHTPPVVKTYNYGSFYTFMPDGTSKGSIFKNLPKEIEHVYIYGNGNNDIDMFNANINIPKTLHCIGNNPALNRLCDVHIKNPDNLSKYLSKNFL